MDVGVNWCGPVPFFFSPLDKIQELSDISLSLSQSETGAFAMTFKFAFGAVCWKFFISESAYYLPTAHCTFPKSKVTNSN